jgi:uncharacterized phage-associated protein
MVSVFDVTKYILEIHGSTTAMKLQKLVYYCQAWSLCWNEGPLFSEKIEAWQNGPVVRELFYEYQGQYVVSKCDKGNSDLLSLTQKDTIKKVVEFYGKKSPQWLSDLTHSEDPWRLARQGIPDGVGSDREISLTSMETYYTSIPAQ